MTARTLPILGIQTTARLANKQSLDDFEQELTELLADFQQTQLVIYPEFHLCKTTGTPKQRQQQYEEMAEPLQGERMQRLAKIAQKLNVWLLPGTVCELGEQGKIYNTAPVFSPDGRLVSSYRKCFPWRPYEPHHPGDELVVFDIPTIGRVGLAICYDIWFPEVVRELAWLGAEVIINQVQTSTCDREQEHILVRANAISNQVFMVSINAATPVGVGKSLIVDPEGNVRTHSTSASTDYLTDVLNLDEITRVRQYGTLGINKMWQQHRANDPYLKLSVYEGGINPQKRYRFSHSK